MHALRVRIHRALAFAQAALDERASTDEVLDRVRASASDVLDDLKQRAPMESAGALDDLDQLAMALRELGRKLSLPSGPV
jgi:hypothetical protein